VTHIPPNHVPYDYCRGTLVTGLSEELLTSISAIRIGAEWLFL